MIQFAQSDHAYIQRVRKEKQTAIDMHSYDLKSTKEFRKNPYANHASLLTKEIAKNGVS